MPIFEVQTPDGQTYEVDAPSAEAAAQAFGSAPQQQQPVGVGEDMARSGVAGLGAGALGLAGTPGDVREGLGSAAEWVAGKFGATPEGAQSVGKMTSGFLKAQPMIPMGGPTTAELSQTVNDAIRPAPNVSQLVTGEQPQTFLEYEPKTWQGKLTHRAGSLAPGVVAGPGGAVMKGAQILGGTLGGEAGERLSEGTVMEPYGEFLGTLAGVGAPALAGKAPTSGLTTQKLKGLTDQAYTQARNSGVVMPAGQFAQVVDDVGNAAVQLGANRRLTPAVRAALKELDANLGRDMTVDELDIMRRNIKLAAGSANPQERMIAKRMVEVYDQGVDKFAGPEFKIARKLNTRYKKSELADELRERAELRSNQTANSGMDNALRTEYRQLARNRAKMRGMTAEERAQIRKIANGGAIENAARWGGKFAPTGPVNAMTGILAGMGGGSVLGGPMGAALGGGIMGAGMASRAIGTRLTNRNVKLAEELFKSGKLPKGNNKIGALARALLTAEAASAGGRPVE